MLGKTLRGLIKYWTEKGIAPHPLEEDDISHIIGMMVLYTLKPTKASRFPKFCKGFLELQNCLETGSFAGLEGIEDGTFSLSSFYNTSWLNQGLVEAVITENSAFFTFAFFDNFAELVESYAETITNPFGTVRIPTDNSITAALNHLPAGYKEILLRLQYDVAKETAPYLFIAVMESDIGFGGPGSTLRLIVDMIESQLFNSKALESKIVFEKIKKNLTIAEYLYANILQVIGPFPSNMAFCPILNHIFYVEASQQQSNHLLQKFIDHCNSEHGYHGTDDIHQMGLHTMIGGFILATEFVEPTCRPHDLFCRSQIKNELVAKLLPFETLKQLFDTFALLDDYKDSILISFSNGVHFIEKHGTKLVSAEHLQKILDKLVEDPEDAKVLLDSKSYDELIQVCRNVLKSV